MADYKAPVNDVNFIVHDVFKLPELWQSIPAFSEVDEDMAKAMVEEASKFCEQEIAPLNQRGDEQGCDWSEQGVKAPEGFKEVYQAFSEAGWGSLSGDTQYGGMQLPKSLVSGIEEMVQGACMSFGLAPMLTAGAALAVDAHGSEALKSLYLPKMYSGEWSGAMDLTEPHCGTDLGLIRTKAQPRDDGSYLVTGTKIFITWGEHDMAENIVHLVLAKLPDAPSGSKGISLFLVPKVLPSDSGELGERNPVSCGSIEKKMGIKGSATCVMNFDGAKGWLVGEPHKGLACMFTMMNYERVVVGIQGVGIAEASYQTAASYAQERIQGRSAAGVKSFDQPADSLLVHADVRRMLFEMRAFNQAARAFYVYVAQFLDMAKYSEDEQQRDGAQKMIALLTPVAKAFITDRAFDTTVNGQQVLGGHGYVREWGQEQHVRDARITQIYEGTNGIQAMDLIGRKTLVCRGEYLHQFANEVREFVAPLALGSVPGDGVAVVLAELSILEEVTVNLVEQSAEEPDLAGAVAVDYQNWLGYIAYGYMWIRMIAALNERPEDEFSKAKRATAQFYFQKIMPRTRSLRKCIEAGADSLMGMDEQGFFL